MTDTLTLDDFYGKDAPVEELAADVIIQSGNTVSGVFTAPVNWTEYEYIEMYSGSNSVEAMEFVEGFRK